MFCPKCGKADQKKNSYCRQCGEFQPDLKALSSLSFGGNTPQQNARTISILSLIAAFISLLTAIWMYVTHFNVPFILFLAAAILLCNAFWHLSNFYVVRKLAGRIDPKNADEQTGNALTTKEQQALPVADTNDLVAPDSVTENTTRKLKVRNEK